MSTCKTSWCDGTPYCDGLCRACYNFRYRTGESPENWVRRKCSSCGAWLREGNTIGICTRSARCRRKYNSEYRKVAHG